MRLEIEPSVNWSPAEINSAAAVRDTKDPQTAENLRRGIEFARAGNRSEARTCLNAVTDSDPDNVDAWMWLASISEYPEELLAFLQNALRVDPANERALEWEASTRSLIAKTFVQRGILSLEEGNSEAAADFFTRAVENDEQCEMAWFWKASMAETDELKESLLGRVLAIDPDNAEAKLAVEGIESRRREKTFGQAVEMAVNDDWAQAVALLDEYLNTNLEDTRAWMLRGHLSSTFEEKRLSFERVVTLDPANSGAAETFEFLDAMKAATAVEALEEVSEPAAEAFEENGAEEIVEVVEVVEAADDVDNASEQATMSAETSNDEFLGHADESELTAAEAASDETEPWQTIAETPEQPMLDEVEYDVEVGVASDDTASAANEEFAADEQEVSAEVTFVDGDTIFVQSEEISEEAAAESDTASEPEASSYEAAADESPAEVDHDSEVESFVSDQPEVNEAQELSFEAAPAIAEEPFVPESNSEVHSEEAPPWAVEAYKTYEARTSADEAASPTAETVEFTAGDLAETESGATCVFCSAATENNAFKCSECGAVTTVSDIEMLLNAAPADPSAMHASVMKMEAEWNLREFSAQELKDLGIGHFNLKNYDRGMSYFQEAARLDPSDVILAGQLNALSLRLEDMRRQAEAYESMPRGCAILVVDDSATVRKLISNKLEKSGHTVICAADGVEAMEALEHFTPDLVLLDIAMPRMDGYQVCKMIRSHETAANVPVVMISGKDGFFDKVRGRMAGCTGYITKPFGPETLMKALDTYLDPKESVVE